MRRRILIAILAAALTMGCGAILPYVVAAGQLAQWIATVLDQVEVAKDQAFEARPSPDLEIKVDQAISRTRAALAAFNEATLAAESAHDGRVEETREHMLACWDELLPLLESSGLLDGSGELLGAAPGASLRVPARAELEAYSR